MMIPQTVPMPMVMETKNVVRHGPAYMKRRSVIWSHFALHRDEGTAECNYCHRMLTYNIKTATTSNLLKHVQSQHPEMLSDEERLKLEQQAGAKRFKLEEEESKGGLCLEFF